MARPAGEESTTELYSAAYLFAQGERAVDICAQLNLSAPRVARLRARAVKQGLLDIRPPVLGPGFTSAMESEALAHLRPGPLSEKLREAAAAKKLRAPATIRVYPSATRATAPSDWDARLEKFGGDCARHIADLLPRGGVAGISWGASLRAVVAAIEGLALPKRSVAEAIRFAPTCGEPLGRTPDKASASNMAGDLDRAINGSRQHSLSLSGVPFVIPIDFNDEPRDDGPSETGMIWKLIARVPAHGEIFGAREPLQGKAPRSEPLADRFTMIITSVSPEGLPFGHGAGEYLTSAGVDVEKLRAAAIGDISGAVLPKSGRDKNALLGKIASHWTGISLDQIRSCAERARGDSTRAGVVVAAIGASKAACVLECLRRGLVTHLVIDSDLEIALRTAVSRLY